MDDEEFRDLERRRLEALVARDIDAAASLHADDYELIPPGGSPISKQDYLRWIASGEIRYETFEPASEVRVRAHETAAIVRYQARIVIHDDEGSTDSGLFWHTDIWEQRGDSWQAVWSQATRIRQAEPEAES